MLFLSRVFPARCYRAIRLVDEEISKVFVLLLTPYDMGRDASERVITIRELQ